MSSSQPEVFRHNVRVPYAHIDKMGCVYYSNYLIYFEMARAELLREVGLPYTEMDLNGVTLPVVESHCCYKKPAHYDDLLQVVTHCAGIVGVRIRLEYEILRDSELLATGYTIHVCVSTAGKVLRPLPQLQRLMG